MLKGVATCSNLLVPCLLEMLVVATLMQIIVILVPYNVESLLSKIINLRFRAQFNILACLPSPLARFSVSSQRSALSRSVLPRSVMSHLVLRVPTGCPLPAVLRMHRQLTAMTHVPLLWACKPFCCCSPLPV